MKNIYATSDLHLFIDEVDTSTILNVKFDKHGNFTFIIEKVKLKFASYTLQIDFLVEVSKEKFFILTPISAMEDPEASVKIKVAGSLKMNFTLKKHALDQLRTFLVKRCEKMYDELTAIFHKCDEHFSN